MNRIVRLTERDLTRIVKRVIMESTGQQMVDSFMKKTGFSGPSAGKEGQAYVIEAGKNGSLDLKYNCLTKKEFMGYNISNVKAELDYFCANPNIGGY
jgi:hypothetical protein